MKNHELMQVLFKHASDAPIHIWAAGRGKDVALDDEIVIKTGILPSGKKGLVLVPKSVLDGKDIEHYRIGESK